jgi:hypothetical protein
MLSIILGSRVVNNPDSNIKGLLDSAVNCVSPEDYGKIEFLIKYDWDDYQRPKSEFFHTYPFTCHAILFERGEGRQWNHHFCEYLFSMRNPSFKWVINMSDDFVFTRKDFLKDIEAIKEEYMVVGYTRPTFEINSIKDVYNKCFPYNFDGPNGIGGYCPLMTAKLLEVCQNFGWQPNPDAWMVLLQATLYRKYGFLLWKELPQFYTRCGSYGTGDTPSRPGEDLYNRMTITGSRLPKNKYLFKLIDQQARNIYLNMMYPDELAPNHLERLKLLHESTPLVNPQSQILPDGYIGVDHDNQQRWLSNNSV